jgi:hypothetical protein
MTIAIQEIKSVSAIIAARFGSKLRDVMVSHSVEVEDGAKDGLIVHQQIPSRLLMLHINSFSRHLAFIVDFKNTLKLSSLPSSPSLVQVQIHQKRLKINSEQDQEAVVRTLSGKIAPELNKTSSSRCMRLRISILRLKKS